MRRKKHKNTRRTLRFYRINFGFRPPYKVIVDGNFVHALASLKRGDAQDLLTKLLGDPVKIYTTKCVMHELRKLGKEMAGEKNPEHFVIATQDRGLQRRVMGMPGGACVFASVNGVHLETPAELQRKQVKQVEEEHMAVKPQEKQSKALGPLDEEKRSAQHGETAAFRRKRAKAPNPLAMKSKQKKAKTAVTQQQQQKGQEGGKGMEGKRKRTRRKANAGTATTQAST